MVLADTSIWMALAFPSHEFHAEARNWFAAQPPANKLLFCRATQQSFLRLLTSDAVVRQYGKTFTNTHAWEFYDSLMNSPKIGFAAEPRDIESRWKKLTSRQTASPKLWMDAYLAAFAIEGGHQLLTTDSAYVQFPQLDLILLPRQ